MEPLHKEILAGKICPYCKKPTEFIDSAYVYGKSYGMIYICKPCDAYVGTHKKSTIALGRLADKKLREAKKEAHKYFDMIWQMNLCTRSEAYKWLSEMLKLSPEHTHIGMFNVNTCREVVFFSKQLLNDNRQLDKDFGLESEYPHFE